MEIINGLLQNNALLLAQATINALKNLPENDSKLTLFKFNTCSDQWVISALESVLKKRLD